MRSVLARLAKTGGKGMIELKLEKSDVDNLLEFFDIAIFDYIKDLLNSNELDNIEYLRSIVKIHDELWRISDEQ